MKSQYGLLNIVQLLHSHQFSIPSFPFVWPGMVMGNAGTAEMRG
jgi:hypothetical protein